MSQKFVSQKIRRTCDGCGAVKEYELYNSDEATITELQNWYTVIREVYFDPQDGGGPRWFKISVQTCSLACVPDGAVKLALPHRVDTTDEPPDNIDLDSLRANKQQVN